MERTTLALACALALAAGAARAQDTNPLENAYSAWVARHEARGGDRNVKLRLAWSKAYSQRHSRASGSATLDLVGRSLRVGLRDLDLPSADVWVVDNVEGGARGAGPDAGDLQIAVGSVVTRGGEASLVASLAQLPPDFDVDLVAVTPSGGTPREDGVLFAAPGLFQRRYTEERRSARGPRGDASQRPRQTLAELIRRGESLFFEETFGGNGRTCGTCHPAENNFTIDREFIATLADDDPLFVAEFVPALAENFENPTLMRELGLILENTNGFEPAATNFTMRGAPHTLGLPVSLTPESDFPMEQATGWSGDGAPNGGSLRQFANGAIRQHFPRSTARAPGVDFRFATDAELDAMEAFQLSLGRDREVDVTPGSPTALVFRSPVAELGKALFNDDDTSDGSAGKCARCHDNAGANAKSSGTNDNFETGVENLPRPGGVPPDDGLGSPGDGTFNTVSLVEAADTPPFFHNNAVATLEEAVDFYNGEAFAASGSGRFLAGPSSGEQNGIAIHLEPDEVRAVAAFLRVLNALENIRSAKEAAQASYSRTRGGRGYEVAAADTADAAEVLAAGGLHADAERALREAESLLRRAGGRRHESWLLPRAVERLDSARRMLVVEEPRRRRQ